MYGILYDLKILYILITLLQKYKNFIFITILTFLQYITMPSKDKIGRKQYEILYVYINTVYKYKSFH